MINTDDSLENSETSQIKNISVLKLINKLKLIGFNGTHKGTWHIAKIVEYCHRNKIYCLKSLNYIYKKYTDSVNIKYTDRFKWNIQDSIDYMEDNPYKDKSLLCSIFIEYKYYETVSALKFIEALIEYVELNINEFI